MYWKFIGDKWEVPQRDVDVQVHIPQEINKKDVIAFGHGSVTGKIKVSDDKTIHFSQKYLPAGTFLESRILMPKNIFNSGIKGGVSKQIILDEEKSFIDMTVKKYDSAQKIFFIWECMSVLIIIIFIFLAIKTIIAAIKFKVKQSAPPTNLAGSLWEPPNDLNPAQVCFFTDDGVVGLTSLIANILLLVNKKYYRIIRTTLKEGSDFRYFLIENDTSVRLTPIEDLVNQHITAMGFTKTKINGKIYGALAFDYLGDWTAKHPNATVGFYYELAKLVEEENEKMRFYSDKNIVRSIAVSNIVITSILLVIKIIADRFILGYFDLGNASIIYYLSYIIAALSYFIYPIVFATNPRKCLNESGLMEKDSWLSFKKHLTDYDVTRGYEIDSTILWQKFLVYGVALGVSEKILNKIKINLLQGELNNFTINWGIADYDHIYFGNYVNSLYLSMVAKEDTVLFTSTDILDLGESFIASGFGMNPGNFGSFGGSSGGFSGGGGGGLGGGGGRAG